MGGRAESAVASASQGHRDTKQYLNGPLILCDGRGADTDKVGGGSERAMFATEGSFPLWHMATSRRAMKNPWGNTGGQVRHCIKGRVAYPGLQTCLSR